MRFFRSTWGDRIHRDCKCFEPQPWPNHMMPMCFSSSLWGDKKYSHWSQPRPSPSVISWVRGPPRTVRWCEGRPALRRAPPPCGSQPSCSRTTPLVMSQPRWLCSPSPPSPPSSSFYFLQTFGLTALLPVLPFSCGQEPENWNLKIKAPTYSSIIVTKLPEHADKDNDDDASNEHGQEAGEGQSCHGEISLGRHLVDDDKNGYKNDDDNGNVYDGNAMVDVS